MSKKGEKYLYIENKSGYAFVILFIVLNVAALLISLDKIAINSSIMPYSLFNIILSLVVFLGAIKQKMYSKKWALACIAIGILQVTRIFWPTPEYRDDTTQMIASVLLVISSVSIIWGSIITLKKHKLRHEAEGLQVKPLAH